MFSTKSKLKLARERKGLTQEELANKINISRAYLSHIESGNHGPSLKVAVKIAKELGMKVEELFL